MVERVLSMHEAPGSIPGTSSFERLSLLKKKVNLLNNYLLLVLVLFFFYSSGLATLRVAA